MWAFRVATTLAMYRSAFLRYSAAICSSSCGGTTETEVSEPEAACAVSKTMPCSVGSRWSSPMPSATDQKTVNFFTSGRILA